MSQTADITTRPVRLRSLTRGQTATVLDSELAESEASVLRSMGLAPDARIRLCRQGVPCIVTVSSRGGGTCRVALADDLARGVMVAVD